MGCEIAALGANEFADLVGNPIVFTNSNGTITATLTLQGETYFSGNRVPDVHLSEAALREFVGRYHSDELDATYTLSLVKGALNLKTGDGAPADLNPVAPNEFQAGDLGTVMFRRAGHNHISGLTLFSQSARGITFQKAD